MNERIALILGSALAAVIVAAPMVWLLGVTDSEGSSSLVEWKMHLRMTLPAMIAVALSAWWHSRGRRIADCPDGTLSSRIACWSFPIFGAISVLVIGIERAVLTDRVAGLVGELAMMSIAMFVMIMLASLVLFIPALLVEYTVVRLVRSDRMRAVLSGVES